MLFSFTPTDALMVGLAVFPPEKFIQTGVVDRRTIEPPTG
jgi:hypothetical protein